MDNDEPLYAIEAEHGHVLSSIPTHERIRHLKEYSAWLDSMNAVRRPELRRGTDGTWTA